MFCDVKNTSVVQSFCWTYADCLFLLFQVEMARVQTDWPAPTSKASSPGWHPPLHLREGWRDDTGRKREEEGRRDKEEQRVRRQDGGGRGGTIEVRDIKTGEEEWKTARGDSGKNPDGDKHKLGRGEGSERGVVGKGSMREKKSQLDKQTNIKQKKRKARKITDLQYTQREAHPSK